MLFVLPNAKKILFLVIAASQTAIFIVECLIKKYLLENFSLPPTITLYETFAQSIRVSPATFIVRSALRVGLNNWEYAVFTN